MTISAEQARRIDQGPVEVVACNGELVGRLRRIVFDEETGRPAWVSVDVGWAGRWQTLVPLDGSSLTEAGTLQVVITAAAILSAPQVDDLDLLEVEDENVLSDYYGHLAQTLSYGDGSSFG